MRRAPSLLLSLMAALLLTPVAAHAQEPPATVSSNASVPIFVRGEEVRRLPASVPIGAEVCVRRFEYLGEGERFSLQRWSHSNRRWSEDPKTECIDIAEPGEYRAWFTHEVLLQVRSRVRAYAQSLWVPRGQLQRLAVPEVVPQEAGVRFRFAEWSAGETPLSPENTMKAWVPEGEEVPVEAPPTIQTGSDQERLSFLRWEGADLKTPRGSAVADRPLEMKAVYERQFMVKVSAPYGASGDGWHAEGAAATVQVPAAASSVLFTERVFDGFPGYSTREPKLQVTVTRPLSITASYTTRVDLKTALPALAVLLVASAVYLVSQRMRASRSGDAGGQPRPPAQPG